jgi:hypothetical protein
MRRWVRGVLAVLLLLVGAIASPVAQRMVDNVWPVAISPPAGCWDKGNPGESGVNAPALLFFVRPSSSSCYTTSVSPLVDGQDVLGIAGFVNRSARQEDNVSIRLELPPGMTLVPGTSRAFNARYPNGVAITDELAGRGINFGSYKAGANYYLEFELRYSEPVGLTCGVHYLGAFLSRIASNSPAVRETVTFTYTKPC